jgi:hypothetical protein
MFRLANKCTMHAWIPGYQFDAPPLEQSDYLAIVVKIDAFR